MGFDPQSIMPRLAPYLNQARLWLAYSGGLDSTVLLHAIARLRSQFTARPVAVHIHHGLSPNADAWAEHCRRQAQLLDVEFHCLSVDATPLSGEGPEAAARTARYQALEALLSPEEALLTAHHRDDQAETVLLRLFRGAGVQGLAAMPFVRPLGEGVLCRPLLEHSRQALQQWAYEQGLDWIDDESNQDERYRRNHLRKDILPRLKNIWPGLESNLLRTAGLCAETELLLRQMAMEDLQKIRMPELPESALPVEALLSLGQSRAFNLLRHWLDTLGLSAPHQSHLQRLWQDVLPAVEEAQPLLNWPGTQVRRYRGQIYAMPTLPDVPPDWQAPMPTDGSQLQLPADLGRLSLVATEGAGISRQALNAAASVSMRFCRGNERCRPFGRNGTKSFKKLCQEAGIPPWMRDRLPVLHIDGCIAAIAGRYVCEEFAQDSGETLRLCWSGAKRWGMPDTDP